MTCFLLPYLMADGPANMALDEAMLEEAARGDAAYLRFYGWTVPTLSLGYFQRMADVRADPRWAGVPIVRRPTGGGAIWHHHELTYAIAVPPHVAARPSEHRAVSGRASGRSRDGSWSWESRFAAAATRPARRIPAQSGHSSALQAGTQKIS